MLISLEVLQPFQPESWFAYLHFFLTHFWLGKSLGCQFKSQLGVIEDFPTVQLRISGKRILADLGTVLMKKRTAGFSTCYPLVCRHLLNYLFLYFFQLRSIIFPILFYPGFLKRQCLCKSAGRHPASKLEKQFKSCLKEKQNSQTCHCFCEKWCLAGGKGQRH